MCQQGQPIHYFSHDLSGAQSIYRNPTAFQGSFRRSVNVKELNRLVKIVSVSGLCVLLGIALLRYCLWHKCITEPNIKITDNFDDKRA